MTLLNDRATSADEAVLGPLDDIPVGAGLAYDIGDEQIAVFRTRAGKVYAVGAVCPHAGGPIADGQADNEVVLCPLHLGVFELATGCSRSGYAPLTTYDARVDEHGQIVVRRRS